MNEAVTHWLNRLSLMKVSTTVEIHPREIRELHACFEKLAEAHTTTLAELEAIRKQLPVVKSRKTRK